MLLLLLVVGVALAQVPPRSVAFDFKTPPAPGVFTPVNNAQFANQMLLLNQGTSNVNAGMFLSSQVWVDSWRANFSFVLGSTGGAHNGGFSFLVQADNIASVGPNNAGLGYGAYTGGAGAGFRRSLALEFDTFFDPQVDDTLANCSTPHFALHSMGAEPNSADEGQANIAKYCYNKFNDPYKDPGTVHSVRLVYDRPVLSVFYDTTPPPVLQVEFDMVGTMQLTDSLAWIGFTSSTGPAGGDMHGITSFSFEYVSSLSANVSVVSGLVPTQAGALSTFLIQSFDVFQHPYPFGGAAVNVTFLGAQPEQQSFTVTDFQNGTYAVSFNCTNSAVTQMEVTLGGIPIQNSPFAVQIVAGDVDSRFGQFSGANTYARAGTPATVNFLVFDRFLNPTNATCSFANSTLSGTPGSIDLQNPILSATGIWSITYVASKVGEYYWTVVANGVPFANQSAPLFVSNGDASAANSTVGGLSASFSAGVNQTISVSVFDSEGNPFTGAVDVVVSLTQGGNSAPVTNLNNASGVYNFQFVLFQAVAWTPSVLINGSAISSANGVPDVIQVLSGPVVPSASQIVYGGTPIQYVAGTNGGVVTILQAKDQYGNLQSSNVNLVWTVSINGVVYQAQPVGTPSGQFQVTWSPVVAGTYVMTALLNGVAVQQSGVYQVVVSGRSNPSADNTVYSGAGWTGAKSGSQTSFTVLLRDVFNNTISGENNVTVSISPQNNPNVQVSVKVAFAAPLYTVTYTPPSSGVYLANVYVNGIQLRSNQVIDVAGPLSVGQIIGIVVGAIGFVAIVIGIIVIWKRKKKLYQPL